MYQDEVSKLAPGIYRVYWVAAGPVLTSVAAVGLHANGKRWIAPTDWVSPRRKTNLWNLVSHVELITTQAQDRGRQASTARIGKQPFEVLSSEMPPTSPEVGPTYAQQMGRAKRQLFEYFFEHKQPGAEKSKFYSIVARRASAAWTLVRKECPDAGVALVRSRATQIFYGPASLDGTVVEVDGIRPRMLPLAALRARVTGLAMTVNTAEVGSLNYIRYKPLLDAAQQELKEREGRA